MSKSEGGVKGEEQQRKGQTGNDTQIFPVCCQRPCSHSSVSVRIFHSLGGMLSAPPESQEEDVTEK